MTTYSTIFFYLPTSMKTDDLHSEEQFCCLSYLLVVGHPRYLFKSAE